MVRFVSIDRETPLLLPYDLREWIPSEHIVHFILEAVELVNIESFKINHKGSGSEQYPPHMMLALLIYSYATGRFSSRIIEEATYSDVIVRYICAGDIHPDHDTICTFRRNNAKAFREAFVKVLMMAGELGHLKKIGKVSIDGSKFKANASKHSAVSYKRSGEMIKQLELEIEELMKKAEQADRDSVQTGLSIPLEIKRREDRKKALEKAREVIEKRFEEAKAEKQAEYEAKKNKREEQRRNGKKPKGPDPKPPGDITKDSEQYNFTDPESRIMKAGNGNHYEQCYNAQLAVETESMLIAGAYVTDNCNDRNELDKVIGAIDGNVLKVETAISDTGYFNEKVIQKIENESDIKVYCAIGKETHHWTLDDLFPKEEPEAPELNASFKEKMKYRLKTKEGKEIYKLRKQTIEPVFGIIKSVIGFREFTLRGLENIMTEFELVKNAYNIKKLYNLIRKPVFAKA